MTHEAYICAAYAVAAIVIILMTAHTVIAWRRAKK